MKAVVRGNGFSGVESVIGLLSCRHVANSLPVQSEATRRGTSWSKIDIMLGALNMASYIEDLTWILTEAAKYFFLLVFSVLAVRLWRRWVKRGAQKDFSGGLVAAAVTLLALTIGYFSMCHSLGTMYSSYGLTAFRAGRLPQALALFETASGSYADSTLMMACTSWGSTW